MAEAVCRLWFYPAKAGGHLWLRKEVLVELGITEESFHRPKELGVEHRGSSRAVTVIVEVEGGVCKIRRCE